MEALPWKQLPGLVFHVLGEAAAFPCEDPGLAQQPLCLPGLPGHGCLQLSLCPQKLVQPRLVLVPHRGSQLDLQSLQPAL